MPRRARWYIGMLVMSSEPSPLLTSTLPESGLIRPTIM